MCECVCMCMCVCVSGSTYIQAKLIFLNTFEYYHHPGWRLMKAGYRTCFHTLYDEKKYIRLNIYTSQANIPEYLCIL